MGDELDLITKLVYKAIADISINLESECDILISDHARDNGAK